jgi:tyrosyl-tRNA synthetase
MRIPDSLLEQWYRLVMEAEAPAGDPMQAKLQLARFVVGRSHGEEAAQAAEEHFTRVVREGQAPDEVEEVEHPEETVYFPGLLSARFGQSSSHWRRVIEQGGVKIDGEPLASFELPRSEVENRLIQAGKRNFLRLVPVP